MKTCVVGLGFGDEGKAKVVDYLAEDYDIVVRYAGGDNAGHTCVIENKAYKQHLVPIGALRNKTCILSAGMVLNPIVLKQEILKLNEEGFFPEIMISHAAHVILPEHLNLDKEKGNKLATTNRGIGPCYASKANRIGAVRIADLSTYILHMAKSKVFKKNMGEDKPEMDMWSLYLDAIQFLEPMITDTGNILRSLVRSNTNILFEGAQGMHLDIDYGTFPFVTSSAVGPAAIPQACGLPNLHLDRIVGVIKCYATRVGQGPFPSEILDNKILADKIRFAGKEFGTTTGRPRRIGWFDLDMTKRAIELSGVSELALMHTDTMMKIFENKDFFIIKDHKKIKISKWKSLSDKELTDFIKYLEDQLNIPITLIGTGRSREQMIQLK